MLSRRAWALNKLYEEIKPQNPYQDFMQQFEQFKKTINGNPKEQVQQLLNSGKISQQQYNAAVQQANMLKSILGM